MLVSDVSPSIPQEELSRFDLRLSAIQYAARGVNLYEFRRMDGMALPAFTAGAHLDIVLPNGLIRQYSLVNSQNERDRYVVGVKHDPASRGGSRYMHESLRVGTAVPVGGPRNHFPLVEDAAHVVLIAGGIGITPIWCMVQRLAAIGASWELHYANRTPADAAFLDELARLGSRVHFHFDDSNEGRPLDLAAIVAAARNDSHFYCCGPMPMLETFESVTNGVPREHVHLEFFSAKEPSITGNSFVLELARSGKRLVVPSGRTILEVLAEAGVDVPNSCRQGICGTCEVRVIAGLPDHRDLVLSEAEKASNKTMMICCSRAFSDKLALDL